MDIEAYNKDKFIELNKRCKRLITEERNVGPEKVELLKSMRTAIQGINTDMTELLEGMSLNNKNDLLETIRTEEVRIKREVSKSSNRKNKRKRYLEKKKGRK